MTQPNASLPLIDIGEFAATPERRDGIAAATHRALSEAGFMYVRGHGIDPALIAQAFAAARDFFAQSRDRKDAFSYTDVAANFGFQGIGVERLDPTNAPDMKESFTMRNALAMREHEQRWPDRTFRDVSMNLFAAALASAHRVLSIIATSVELPADFFTVRHGGENVTLRFLHYPANLPQHSATQLGAGAHTDYGSITLLFQDEVGGLEAQDARGEWQQAPSIADAALINTGDLMERWTNGQFRSTLHRVQPVTGHRDRYSIAMFVDPDSDVQVDCLAGCISEKRPARYPSITAAEHLRQKIAATHG
jgi:isopenicillin N synthase-like dioxygenase